LGDFYDRNEQAEAAASAQRQYPEPLFVVASATSMRRILEEMIFVHRRSYSQKHEQ
jgi:hypothetical protein